jgi:hypothetical protein
MKKVILQIWEESTENKCRPDGCSLHIDSVNREKFIDSVYKDRRIENIPLSYERIVGLPVEVFIKVDLFNIVSRDKSIRLMKHEMNNLLMSGDMEVC